MSLNPLVPPPPYSPTNESAPPEPNTDNAALLQPQPGGGAFPPAYSRPEHHRLSPAPGADEKHPDDDADSDGGVPAASAATASSASAAVEAGSSNGSGSSSSRLSFIKNPMQVYEEKRRAKEAKKKVDFYEKTYGFVPKNVMSEAEWRAARESMPKVKPAVKGPRSRPGVLFS